jgi:hypothetical protein
MDAINSLKIFAIIPLIDRSIDVLVGKVFEDQR